MTPDMLWAGLLKTLHYLPLHPNALAACYLNGP